MPDPLVIRIMRQFKADLLAGETAMQQEMARRWLRVEARLSSQMDALALAMDAAKRDGATVSAEMLMNDVRYRQLLVQLTAELETYTDYAEVQITAQQRRLGRLAVAHSSNAIEVQGIAGGFYRLPTEAVEYMVGNVNGQPLRGLLVSSWPEAADGLTQALVNGVALGYNPRKTAQEMAVGATRSLNRMMVISRTETLRVYREASRQNYIASGVVSGYKRLCAHDSRVCPACLMDEGHLYSLDEQMPEHPQGRCTAVPVVEGVPQPRWLGGADWFEQQDVPTQKSILGMGRYYAWQNGDIDLRDLPRVVQNGVWGPSLQVVPLKELLGVLA